MRMHGNLRTSAFWSVWLGLIVALIGLVAFGGFVRGKWY